VDLDEAYLGHDGGVHTIPARDRKQCAVCALHPLASPDQRLVVLGTHLMTTSRDNAAKCAFPGEIRARELATIRRIAAACSRPNDAVVLTGDFNINLRGNRDQAIIAGNIPHTSGEEDSLHVPTGFVAPDDGTGQAAHFDWSRADGSRLLLADAYSGQSTHEIDAKGHCLGSSHNAVRIETIDFCWFDSSHLQNTARSSLRAPMPDGTPSTAHPSDHIPLVLAFHHAHARKEREEEVGKY